MKYRLKDRELQAKLDAISNGDFSKQLQIIRIKSINMRRVNFGESTVFGTKFVVWLDDDEVEEVPEYDPHAWNEWPKVTPPKDVLMRCELYSARRNIDTPEPTGGKLCGRTSGFWNGREWSFYGHGSLLAGCVVRFRPWEDEE